MRHGIDWMVVLITVSAIALCSVDAVAQCTPTHALNIRLVDADAQGPGEDGRSWPCAYRSLDAALFEASQGLAITEIWVAASTYIPITQFNANNPPFPTDFAERTATFPVRSYLHVHGGFLGNAHPSGGETSLSQADPEANETILSGEVTIAGKNDNSYHVLVLRAPDGPLQNNRTIIDGFTIIDGIANGALNNAIGGGAMVFPTGTVAQIPLFSRCKFIGNRAAAGGGAVSSGFNSAEFRDCAFIDNEAVGNGSSVHAGGGAIQASLGFDNQLRVAKCRFENNRCPENFGGAIKSEALSTKVVNSTFLENEALRGGATYSTGTYAGCLFAGNLATTAAATVSPRRSFEIAHLFIIHRRTL